MRSDGCGQNIRRSTFEVPSLGSSNGGTQCRLFVRFFIIAEHFNIFSSDNAEIDITARAEVVEDSCPNSILNE